MIYVLFCSPLPASIQHTHLFYVMAQFYTHPTHLHLFIIVSLMKLRMEVDILRAGGLGSYDSHSWKPGQGVFHGHYCHIWRACCSDSSEVPLWTHSGDSIPNFFPWRGTFRQTRNRRCFLRVLLFKAKQKTWLVFCCCWSTTFDLCPGKRTKNAVFLERLLETLQRCFPQRGYSAGEWRKAWGMEREHLSIIQNMSSSTAGSLQSSPKWEMVGIYVFPEFPKQLCFMMSITQDSIQGIPSHSCPPLNEVTRLQPLTWKGFSCVSSVNCADVWNTFFLLSTPLLFHKYLKKM